MENQIIPTMATRTSDIFLDTSSTAINPIQDPVNYLWYNFDDELFNLETPPYTPEEPAGRRTSILEELVDHNQMLEPSTSSCLGEECAPEALLELEPPLQPYVRIDKQPNDTARYRYQSELVKEKRCTGVIPGRDSTPERPTYPTISLCDYPKQASRKPFVVASCVTHELPYRAHPNQLYGGNGNTRIVGGMAVADIDGDEPKFELSRVGIVRMLKGNNEIRKSLEERAQAEVHPKLLPSQIIFPLQYGTVDGYKYNMTRLRLAFQVFVPVGEQADAWHALEPAVSDPLHLATKHDSDATALPLQIDEVSPIVGGTDGGTRIVIFLKKDNLKKLPIALKVKFHEEDERGWVAEAHVEKVKWCIIVVLTPRYGGRPASSGERVQVYLRVCSSAGETVSDSVPFQYHHWLPPHTLHVTPPPLPADAELDARAKRLCTDEPYNEELNEHLNLHSIHSTDENEEEHEPDEHEKDLLEHFGVMKL